VIFTTAAMNDPNAHSASGASTGGLPPDWQEALIALVASRIELIRLESREAARAASRKGVMAGAGAALLIFGWLLALAALVGIAASVTGLGWHWVALVTALMHLIPAFFLLRAAKAAPPPTFPVTRDEFIKDREWLNNLRNHRKSND